MIILALAAALAAPDAAFEDLAALDARIAQIGPAQVIDKRLKLPRCPQPAEITQNGPSAFAIRCSALGWRLLVPRDDGPASAMEAPDIQRGDGVELVLTGDGFALSTPATALDQGRKGEQVRIKILQNSTILQAVVIGRGQAEVQMGAAR
ncbi:MAG: flagella basal body P-ring formation protein FlgA [Chakrabartia sp.]